MYSNNFASSGDSEIIVDGVSYIPSKDAATRVALNADYISRFCRGGLVQCTQVGGMWYVNEDSLRLFIKKQELQKREWRKTQAQRRRSEQAQAGMLPKQATAQSQPFESTPIKNPAIMTIAPRELSRPQLSPIQSPLLLAPAPQKVLLKSIVFLIVLTSTGLAFEMIAPPETLSRVHVAAQKQAAAIASIPIIDKTASAFYNFVCPFVSNCKNSAVATNSDASQIQKPLIIPTPLAKQPTSKPVTAPVVQNIVNNPIVERIRETVRTVVEPGVNASYVDERLSVLEGSLLERIAGVSSSASNSITQVYTATAQAARIEHLDDLDLTDPTITRGTITGTTIASLGAPLPITSGGTGTSTAPTYGKVLLGNSGGTYDLVATSSLGITNSGSSSFGQAFEIANSALSPTTTLGLLISASSTFNGGVSIDRSTTTNSTSTNLFATNANFTNATSTN